MSRLFERKIFMDNNLFSLDALLESPEFTRYESKETTRVFCEFGEFAETHCRDIFADELNDLVSDYGSTVFSDGFKQGFCFAVKSIKFLMKI